MKKRIQMLAVMLLGSGCACEDIEGGHVGVMTHYGAVQNGTLGEGRHYEGWGEEVKVVDTRLRTFKIEAEASSSDLQLVVVEVVVPYSVVGSMAPVMLQKIGGVEDVEKAVLGPAILESSKAAMSQFTAEGLIKKRAEVKAALSARLDEFIVLTLTKKEVPGLVVLGNVAITNFKFSKEFDAAIESKLLAEQKSLQAVQEAVKKKTDAESAKEVEQLQADARAYKIEKESIARSTAIQREASALKSNPELIQLRIAERWDGKLPHYTGGKDTIPMLKLD